MLLNLFMRNVELFLDTPAIWLFIAGLATWRITSIVHTETIAYPFRKLFGISHDTEKHPFSYPDTFFGNLLACFWCISVWVAIVVVLIFTIFPYVLLPFALSAVAILIDRIL